MNTDLLEYIKENCSPEVYEEALKHEIKNDSKKPYTPTPEEKETLKEILGMNDEWIDAMETYIMNDGDICVITPDAWWKDLCGREWWVNMKERKSIWVSMN